MSAWFDPAPGDEIHGKSGMLRRVLHVERGDGMSDPVVVFEHARNGASFKKRREWLRDWKRWCQRNAVN